MKDGLKALAQKSVLSLVTQSLDKEVIELYDASIYPEMDNDLDVSKGRLTSKERRLEALFTGISRVRNEMVDSTQEASSANGDAKKIEDIEDQVHLLLEKLTLIRNLLSDSIRARLGLNAGQAVAVRKGGKVVVHTAEIKNEAEKYAYCELVFCTTATIEGDAVNITRHPLQKVV